MKSKPILTILSTLGLSSFILSEVFFVQLSLINITITLISFIFLPLLIKSTFKLKFHFSLLYLAYLLIFVVLSVFSNIGILDPYLWSALSRSLLVFGFFGISILKLYLSRDSALPSYKEISAIALICLASVLITFIGVRQINSLVSPDILQHQAVVNQAFTENKVCILPSQCNNLFLKDGYTTLYHSFLFFASPLSENTNVVLYNLDIAWVIVCSIAVFIYCKRYFDSTLLTSFATLIALHIFINYAYPFSFFVPQTLVFLIFLLGFTKEKLTKVELAVFSLVLVATHFIIGSYLAVFLIAVYLLKDLKLPLKAANSTGILGVIFTLLLSAANLSFESLIQEEEVKFLGGSTNPMFPENILDLVNTGPIIILLFLFSLGFYFISKKLNENFGLIIYLTLLSISIYFLGPTYAKKFLLGISIWMAIIVVATIHEILRENFRKLLGALSILSVVSILSFTNSYLIYQNYFNSSDTVSILKTKDQGLLNFLDKSHLDCILISDPISQIVITGLTKYETYKGQYMEPAFRILIQIFLQNPTKQRFNDIPAYLGDRKMCFAYSYRLEEARAERKDMWANQLYNYIVDSSKTLNSDIEPIKTLGAEMDLVYKDKYYYVFR